MNAHRDEFPRTEGRLDTLRVPPMSAEAEQAVVGGLMLAPDRMPLISDWLTEADFYRRDHRLIFRAIADLIGAEKPVDPVTMGEWFEANGLAEQIGGTAYLWELLNNTPSAANIVSYAEIVVEKSRLRQAIEKGSALVSAAFSPGATAADVTALAQTSFAELAPVQRTGLLPVEPILRGLYSTLVNRFDAKQLPGMPTPWHDLNEVLHGLQDGEVYVVAGRSNMGKSVIGFQQTRFTALRGDNVARFSIEMSAQQAMRRDIAALGEIPYDWMVAPSDRADYWSEVNAAIKALRHAPMQIDDTARLTASQICGRARRAHLQKPLRLVLIDHLHEVRLPGKQNENIERGDAMREFKALAKSLNCPVIVLCQLNREAARDQGKETGRRPTLTDLRGSGGIEEVADVVLLLHRPDYYRPKDRTGAIEVIVGKGREVKTGSIVYLRNRFDVMRADDWDGPPPEEPTEDSATPRRSGGLRRQRPDHKAAAAADERIRDVTGGNRE